MGEWANAVGAITPREYSYQNQDLNTTLSVSDAVAIIRATPHLARSRFAAEMRKHMKGRRRAAETEASERWNPAKRNGIFSDVFGSRTTTYDLGKARKEAADREERLGVTQTPAPTCRFWEDEASAAEQTVMRLCVGGKADGDRVALPAGVPEWGRTWVGQEIYQLSSDGKLHFVSGLKTASE